jgi:hypothetical protein
MDSVLSYGTDEATFAKQLAKELYRRAHSGDFAALVLIADPQTLGQIRPTLHKEVQDRLVSEIGGDWRNPSSRGGWSPGARPAKERTRSDDENFSTGGSF